MRNLCLVVLTAVLGQFAIDAKRDVRDVSRVDPKVPIMVTMQQGVDEVLGNDGVTISRTITETLRFDVTVRTLEIAVDSLGEGPEMRSMRCWAGFDVNKELNPDQPLVAPPGNVQPGDTWGTTVSAYCSGPDRTCGLIACEVVNGMVSILSAVPATP